MSIRKKLLLGLTPGLLFTLALALLAYEALQAVAGRTKTIERAFRQHDAMSELQLAVQQVIMPANDYLITGDLAERDRFVALAAEVEVRFAAVEALIGETDEGRALLANTRGEWQQVRALTEIILALPDPAGNAEGARLMEQMDALADELTGDFTDLHHQQEAQIAAADAAVHATQSRVKLALLLGTALALAGSVAFGWFFSAALTRPLITLARTATALSQGDLAARAAVEGACPEPKPRVKRGGSEGDDEVARLGRAFNAMADRLQRHLNEQHALNAIIGAAAAALDLPDLLEVALEQTLRALGLEMGVIWVADHVALYGLPPEVGQALRDVVTAIGPGMPAHLDGADGPASIDGPLSDIGSVVARFGIRDSVTAPLLAEGRPVGGLSVAAPELRAWSPEEVALVEAVGRELGSAAERARLFASTQEHATLMGRLQPLSEALNRPHSMPEVLETIGQGAMALSRAERAALYRRNPDDTVECPWFEGLSPAYVEQVTGRVREMPGGRLLESMAPVLIPDVEGLPEGSPVRGLAGAEGYRAVGLWPLVYEGRVLAAVGCYYDAPHAWSRAEEEVMEAFARQAAAALENARLFEQTRRRADELEALAEVSSALRTARTVEEMLPVFLQKAIKLVGGGSGTIFLVEPATGDPSAELAPSLHSGQALNGVRRHDAGPALVARCRYPPHPNLLELRHRPGEGITDHVAATGEIHISEDLARDGLACILPGEAGHLSAVRSSIALPLRTQERTIGVMHIGLSEQRAFADEEVRLLTAIAEMAGNALQRARTHEELEAAYIETVLALANAMNARDTYTGDHGQRLAAWAEAIARKLGCNEAEVEVIRWGALLHDIGKIGVPDEILHKPGPPTEEEWAIIKQHPETGAQIVGPVKKLANVVPIIRHHQEKWDGTGYPDGLEGEAIPLGARVLAVVDAYGAMTDERVYRKARSHEEAVAELRRCAGRQFDPCVVEAFLSFSQAELTRIGASVVSGTR